MSTTIRRYAKTPEAWEALARPDIVGRRAHTLLLMANGRRSELELSRLLGEDISALAECLQQRGLLQDSTWASSAATTEEDALAGA